MVCQVCGGQLVQGPQGQRCARCQPAPGPQHNLAQGTLDMGGGHQLEVQIDGKTPEKFLKDKASSMIWGWVIGAVIIGIAVIGIVGTGIYVYIVAKDNSDPNAAAKSAAASKWDGKSTFTCGGNDVVSIQGVTANVSDTAVKATGNCKLTLVSVSLTAPTGIEAGANAKVTMTNGSIKASGEAVVASASAKVDLVGTSVSGKVKKSGGATVTSVN